MKNNKILLFNELNKSNDSNIDFVLTDINNKKELSLYDKIYHVYNGPGEIIKLDSNRITIKYKDGSILSYSVDYLIDTESLKKIKYSNNNNNSNNNSNNIKIKEIEEEEEEEEEEDDDDDYLFDDITIDELLTIKIEEFFNENELDFLISYKDIIDYKNRINDTIVNNKFKELLKQKKLNEIEILIMYFDHLSKRIPGYKIYKFNGQIPYNELWDIRQKDRINIPDNLRDKHIFNSGVFYYWVFKNGIIFKPVV